MEPNNTSKALIIDINKCNRRYSCQIACKERACWERLDALCQASARQPGCVDIFPTGVLTPDDEKDLKELIDKAGFLG